MNYLDFLWIYFELILILIYFFLVVSRPDKISGADIHSICQEAGMQAVRRNRYIVLPSDFETAYKKVITKKGDDFDFYK